MSRPSATDGDASPKPSSCCHGPAGNHLCATEEIMKAVRIHEFGGPDRIVVEDVPTPEPRPGEVLVRVVAAALNPVDWKIREHLISPKGADRVPLTLGQDFSGVVIALGPGAAEPVPNTVPRIRF